MKTRIILGLLLPLVSITSLFADPSSSVDPLAQPSGDPVRIEILVVLALVAFVLFKLFGVGKKPAAPPPPPPPPPKAKPLLVQVNEAIGGMEEVGDKTYMGSKLVASSNDSETYLMMAKVDRSHIRQQEQAMASEIYEAYEKKIFYFKIAIGLFIVFILAISHETLIEWFQVSYNFIKDLFTDKPGA